jgi:cyanophycin synthetase
MNLEDFAGYVARSLQPNSFPTESASHSDGFVLACRDSKIEMQHTGKKHVVFLHSNRPIGEMRGMVTNLTDRVAIDLCKDKSRTLDLLKAAGVPTPASRYFHAQAGYDEALLYWQQAEGDAIVVKPSDASGGDGVTVGIPDAQAFDAAWAIARDALSDAACPIILEERVSGLDVRAIVVNGRFICAATRVQPHVIGDGHSNAVELVARKNEHRQQNAYHRRYPLQAGSYGNVVPAAGQVLFLSAKANIHQGGEAVDVTELVPDAVRATAERAAQAIPGLGVAGVDLIADFEIGMARVIEINTSCNFCIHYYPMYGTPRNPARSILKEMLERADRGLSYRPKKKSGVLYRVVRRLHRIVRPH